MPAIGKLRQKDQKIRYIARLGLKIIVYKRGKAHNASVLEKEPQGTQEC